MSSSGDEDQSPDEEEELQMEEKHEEEGYREVFHIPAQEGEHSVCLVMYRM